MSSELQITLFIPQNTHGIFWDESNYFSSATGWMTNVIITSQQSAKLHGGVVSLCVIRVLFILTISVAFQLTGCCDFHWGRLHSTCYQHLNTAPSLQDDCWVAMRQMMPRLWRKFWKCCTKNMCNIFSCTFYGEKKVSLNVLRQQMHV